MSQDQTSNPPSQASQAVNPPSQVKLRKTKKIVKDRLLAVYT